MALRTAIAATAFLGTIATLYHVTTSQTSIMASLAPDQAPLRDVSVELASADAPLTIKVTIRNDSPDKTFFLSWDSPFDPKPSTPVFSASRMPRQVMKFKDPASS